MSISSFHFTFVCRYCCVRHASLQTGRLILSGQKSTGDGLTTHGWPPSGSILSHKLQSLSGAPKSPPHNNKSHPQLISWAVCCWRIAGRAFLCQIYTVYRRWWSIPYYYGKAAQTSPFPATMKWGSYSDKVRCGVVVAEYDKHGCVHLSGRSYV